MGDVPIAYIEGAGGVRVAEDEIVEVGKNDVSSYVLFLRLLELTVSRFCHSRLAECNSTFGETRQTVGFFKLEIQRIHRIECTRQTTCVLVLCCLIHLTAVTYFESTSMISCHSIFPQPSS